MIIVKVGGGKTINWPAIYKDISFLIKKEKIILVHGASYARDQIANKLARPIRYLTAPNGQVSVHTDKKALDILTMVYGGLVNKKIVAGLQSVGVNAVGLSGADGKLWQGKRKKYLVAIDKGKKKLIKDTYTGVVEKINTNLLKLLLQSGYSPVITQPAITSEGELINTDNDRVIAVMAKQLKVKSLVVLFEASGFLKNPPDDSTLIPSIKRNQLTKMMDFAQGRMKKKLLGAKEALKAGVQTIYWSDGRTAHPITAALEGKGTVIK